MIYHESGIFLKYYNKAKGLFLIFLFCFQENPYSARVSGLKLYRAPSPEMEFYCGAGHSGQITKK